MKKGAIFISILLTIIIGLSLVQVILSNSLSTTGLDLSRIEKETKLYKNENAVLREKLLIATSLSEIASKAAALGFSQNKSRVFVRTSMPIAVKP